jgi:RNA recognition motif-containing protein
MMSFPQRQIVRQPKDNAIHVSNLPPGATVEFIRSLFSECGTVINVILKNKPTGSYCFVEFADRDEAEKAVRDFNYTKLNGESIVITLTNHDIMSRIVSGEGNLFIRGIDESIEAPQLHELFSNFGEVISCKIPILNGKPRGYAYVQFANPADGDRAMKELADSTINGKPITIEKFVNRGMRAPTKQMESSVVMDPTFTNVFIKNLPDTVTTLLDLLRLFQEFGQVLSARIVLEKRSGFVRMVDHEAAVRAVLGLNGRIIYGRTISCCRSLSIEERAAFAKKKQEQDEQDQEQGNDMQPPVEHMQFPEQNHQYYDETSQSMVDELNPQ